MRQVAVVLDTNIFVGAGFNRQSTSARLLDAIRSRRLRLVWDQDTRRETKMILDKIPPLSWDDVAKLFRDENRYSGRTTPEAFPFIPDPDDRKFAALADATGAALITSDDHLLSNRDRARLDILTPTEFARRKW